jgi:hypothetical protein
MAEKAPEVHVKALTDAISGIGTAARAIDEAAKKLATVLPSAPAVSPSSRPASSPK